MSSEELLQHKSFLKVTKRQEKETVRGRVCVIEGKCVYLRDGTRGGVR